jgi:hypothetical protein
MATVEISSDLANALARALYNNTGFSYDGTTLAMVQYFGYMGGNSGIAIMKGTPPTSFSGLTTYNARSADTLLFYSCEPNWGGGATFTNSQFILTTPFVAATQSGTATWFWGLTTSSPPGTGTIRQQMIGTVGATGSGADLEISNTNIVSGTTYQITNLKIKLPTTWTV